MLYSTELFLRPLVFSSAPNSETGFLCVKSPGCLGTCFVDQTGLELRDLPASASSSSSSVKESQPRFHFLSHTVAGYGGSDL